MSLNLKASRIKLLLFDVDGVLTDGTVIVHSDGTESKTFGIRDGIGMVWAQRAGLKVGLLSARMSATTPHRAAQLGITIIQQGVANKLEGYKRIITDLGIGDEAVAYMGDDIVDLGVLDRVGFAAAPADAVREVKKQVDWVSAHPGGRGAVRELIELILRAQQRWATVVGGYAADNERVTTARKGARSPARGKAK
jgi:3-deoxy-D-manno-octulosonate 8-phosphate phosphatase (KDO 8-P phosphatase)